GCEPWPTTSAPGCSGRPGRTDRERTRRLRLRRRPRRADRISGAGLGNRDPKTRNLNGVARPFPTREPNEARHMSQQHPTGPNPDPHRPMPSESWAGWRPTAPTIREFLEWREWLEKEGDYAREAERICAEGNPCHADKGGSYHPDLIRLAALAC